VVDPNLNRTVCAITFATTSVCCNGICCDGCCDAAGVCGACRVFLTDDPQFNGKLGGLIGADSKCLKRARDGNLPGASLPGNYKAWLSDSTLSPATRFRQSAQPYVLPDDTKVADDWADLTTCESSSQCLDSAIRVAEGGGTFLGSNSVWTHTQTDGTAQAGANHCNNWQSSDPADDGDTGDRSQFDATWTDSGSLACSRFSQLYCFQQS
jgi:hypothetical protein